MVFIFHWEINDFITQFNKPYARLLSGKFYAFDYLLQLEIIIENERLRFGGIIWKGDFDDGLPWPFKKFMVLSIHNLTSQMPLWNFNITPNLYEHDNNIWIQPTKQCNDSFMVNVPIYDWQPNNQITVRLLIN